MERAIKNIRKRAAKLRKHIIFPEAEDERILKAAGHLTARDICEVTLVGDAEAIKTELDNRPVHIIDTAKLLPHLSMLTDRLWQRRKEKLDNKQEAENFLQNRLNYAAAMIESGKVDGGVAGSVASTGKVIRSAIQCIGIKKDAEIVSSCFLMAFNEQKTLTYADCGVVPYPNAKQLADIAVETSRTHRRLTAEEPIVAMLSFSTRGSARHERVSLVRQATELVKEKNIELRIDGELQFDAAFVPQVAKRKVPDSEVAGNANVFIFPNIDAGNISYKITERLAGASATGPILQGLAKPMMDLSRGCSWEDIVNAACVAILMSEE